MGFEKCTETGFGEWILLGLGAGFPEGSSAPNALGASRGDPLVLTGSWGGVLSRRGLMQCPRQVRLSTQPVAVSPNVHELAVV